MILVVGLTGDLIGEHTPNIAAFAKNGGARPLTTITPAVTCSVQATFMTGTLPADHGCVANGWYFKDLAEVMLWRQPERLVAGEKIWDAAKLRDPEFTCAKMFWWYNMYSSADIAVTPRPMYPADGRKLPDVWAQPGDLRGELTKKFGTFPLFNFWGPTADIKSTQWIANSTRYVFDTRNPDLTLVYLPHLDYCLQKRGPDPDKNAKDLREVDDVCGELIEHFTKQGARVVLLSEYGITPVSGAVHINRALREAGLIAVRDELGLDVFDAGASDAFAVADHQVAHIYVRRPENIDRVKALVEGLPGVEKVLDEQGKKDAGLDHPNSGELVAVSDADKWFTYYYWLDDDKAPDYARTVDIHRKPGYDPVELFLNPKMRLPKVRIAAKLAKKMAGFRTLMDFISFDTTLVKGSHGRLSDDPKKGPVFIGSDPDLLPKNAVSATDVKGLVLDYLFKK